MLKHCNGKIYCGIDCVCPNVFVFRGMGERRILETLLRDVYTFDYSPDGPLTNKRLVWRIPADMPRAPDGAQVDVQG